MWNALSGHLGHRPAEWIDLAGFGFTFSMDSAGTARICIDPVKFNPSPSNLTPPSNNDPERLMEEDHYDTPWEFLTRPSSVRLSNADAVLFAKRSAINVPTASDSPQCSPVPHSPSFSNHLVHIGNSPLDSKRHSLRAERPRRVDTQNEEETLLEKNIDRVGAEKLLESRGLGDFLLRSRGEGSAALSLRGASGVLHIKLERRGDKWVIGEGPCFRSISSAVHYYRRHPLPIRGSDHLLLNASLTNTVRL